MPDSTLHCITLLYVTSHGTYVCINHIYIYIHTYVKYELCVESPHFLSTGSSNTTKSGFDAFQGSRQWRVGLRLTKPAVRPGPWSNWSNFSGIWQERALSSNFKSRYVGICEDFGCRFWWDSSTPRRTDTVWEWPRETKSRRICLVCMTMGHWFAWFVLPTLLCKEISGLQPWLGDKCIDGLLQARAWPKMHKDVQWRRNAEKYTWLQQQRLEYIRISWVWRVKIKGCPWLNWFTKRHKAGLRQVATSCLLHVSMETLPWIAPGRLQDPITAGLQNFNLANPHNMFSENPVVKPLPGYLTSSWYNDVIHKSGRERLILGACGRAPEILTLVARYT